MRTMTSMPLHRFRAPMSRTTDRTVIGATNRATNGGGR